MDSGAGGTGDPAGGSGGGKTQRKRCHQRSIPPNRQDPQRPQSILSRVIEYFKNIVPRWLQTYFSRDEDVCTCSTDRRQAPQQSENREDDHLTDADEESANIHDGRITPEPPVSHSEDPTTTPDSNSPPASTMPSFHGGHLNPCVLESPALICQPSTSSAFPTGSTGVSLVKETKDSTSQSHDGKISTIRGVSSRASAKDIGASKSISVPRLWSVETEPHSVSQNMATSSRERALEYSPFKRFSQSIGKSSIPKTSQFGNSNFYPVKERYGGPGVFIKQPQAQHTPCQSGNETNTTPGHNREQQKSGVCYTNVSVSSANVLPSGGVNGDGKFIHERMGFVATKPLEEEIGFTLSQPVNKTGSRSVSEPVTNGSDTTASKNTAVPLLWPVESGRYNTLSQHTATSSKKRAFNLSAFGKCSLSIGEPSILKRNELRDSTSYPGKTTCGGAVAVVRQPKVQNIPFQVPVIRQMKTNQVNTQFCGVDSLRARRILQSLELSKPLSAGSQYPVHSFLMRKPVSIAGNRTAYSQSFLTTSDELKKTNQRVDKKLNSGDETNTTAGHVREQQKSGVCYTNFSMSADNILPSGGGNGDGKFVHERTGFVATKLPEEEIGFTVTRTIEKTTERSGFSVISDPVTKASDTSALKNTAVPLLWPTVADGYHTLCQHTTTSSEKPAFSVSGFRRLSLSTGDSTILKTRELGDSHFYPGKTRYGGAAAVVRQHQVQKTPYEVPVRRQMKTNQLNRQSCGGMSLTARRILQCLEMSTPLLMDAQYSRALRPITEKPAAIPGNQTVYFKPSLTPLDELRKANQMIDKKLSMVYETAMKPGQYTEQGSMSAANVLPSGVGNDSGKTSQERTGFVATKPPKEEIAFTVHQPVGKTTELFGSSVVSVPVTSGSDTTPSKNTTEPPLWPMEADRYHTLLQHTATISRKPAFNVSVFGRPSLEPKGFPLIVSSALMSPRYRSGIDTTRNMGAKRQKVDSQYPPVQRLIIPKPVSIAVNPTVYLKQNLTTSSELKKTNQRINKNLSTGYEKAMKAGQNTTQERMCEASDSSCGVGNEGDSKTEEKMGLVATKPAEEEVGLAFTVPDTKTTEPSGSKSTSEPIASSSNESDPALNSSSSNVPTSLSSGGCLDLDKLKKPAGSWDCEVCLVLNKPEATKCVACESAKPGTNSAFEGLDKTTSYSEPAVPSFKIDIASSTAGSLQTFTATGNTQFGNQEDLQMSMSSDSGYSKPSCESIAFSKGTGSSKPGVSSDSKPEEVQKDNKNDDNFEFELCSGLSHPASLAPLQCDIPNVGQQEKKEEGTKPSSVGFSLGMGDVIPSPAATSAIVTTEEKSSFTFGSKQTKAASVAPVTFEVSDAEKEEEMPTTKGLFISGNLDPATVPLAPFPVLGRTGDEQPAPGTSSAIFEKNADKEETKCQPVFSFENSKQDKSECSSKLTVSFNTAKPSEKINEEPTEANFKFQGQTNTVDDQVSENPVFSLLNETSFISSLPAPSATGSTFGSSTPASRAPVAAPVYRQASSGSSSTFCPSARLRTCQALAFSPETVSATPSSTGTAVNTCVSPPGVLHNNTAWSGISIGATTTPKAADFSFVIDTGPSVPSASPETHVKQTPTSGQSQVAKEQNHLGFGSLSPSTSLFSAGSQPEAPTLGTVSRDSQPPVFEQKPVQSAFHGAITPNSNQVSENPVFSLLNETSFISSLPAPSATGSTFGSSTPASRAPVAAPVYRQASSGGSSTFCPSARLRTCQALAFSPETVSATPSSTGTAVNTCVSPPGVLHNNTAWSGISIGATTTPKAADFSFVIDTGPSVPSASPETHVKQTPTSGQSQVAKEQNHLGFGSLSPSTSLFSAGSQPEAPTLGTVSRDSQPPVFEQKPVQSAFHGAITPNSNQVSENPVFSLLNETSFISSLPAPSATGSTFGSSTPASRAPVAAPVYRQASSGGSSTFCPSARLRTCQALAFSPETVSATPSSTGTAVNTCVSPPGVLHNNTAWSGISIGATTTPKAADFSFVIDTGPSVPSASPETHVKQTPTSGQSQVAKEQNHLGFGSLSPSTSLFSAGSQPEAPTLGTVSRDSQPPVFEQKPVQSAFHGAITPNSNQVSENPVFSLLNETSFISSLPAPSATGSTFGSSTPASRAPVAAPVYRQASSGGSSTFCPSARLRTCQALAFSPETVSATPSSTGTAVNTCVSPPGVLHNNTAWSGISIGATTTPKAADFSFVIDTGPSVPSASPETHVKQTPTSGQSQVAKEQNHLGFGSLSPSTSLFSAGSQPEAPTLGTVSRDSQPPVFEQKPVQSAFHGAITPNSNQVSENPVFSLLNETSFISSLPAPSATGSTFGSSTPASRAPVAAPVYRQASSGGSSTFCPSARLRTCQALAFSPETVSATPSSTGTAVNTCVSPPGVLHNNTAWSGISIGATTTPKAADFSFVIDTGPSVPSASPEIHVKQTPTSGQSQVAKEQNHLGFGSLSPSTSLFSAGSQPEAPTLGTVSRDSQPPVFEQKPVQSAFHGAITPNSSPVSSNPEVSLPNETSFNSSLPAPSATGSTLGSSTPAPRAPVAGAVYRQASSGSSSAVCNSARSRTFPPLARSKNIKPAPTSSTGTAVNPCVSGSGVLRNNTTRTRINFGATTTPRAAGKQDLNSALKGLEPFLRRRQGVSPKSP